MHMRGGSRYEKVETPKITKALVFRILSYFRPYWKPVTVTLIAVITTSILGVIPSLLTKNIIDVALPKGELKLLLLYIGLSFGAQVVLTLISVGQNYLNNKTSKYIIRDLKVSMYDHLQNLSLKFFSEAKTGEITSRINSDIGGIEHMFSGTILSIVSGVFTFATTAVTLFYTNWILAIVSLLTLPLFLLPTKSVGKKRWEIAKKTQEKQAELTTIITETLNVGGTMIVKLFTKEKAKRKEFENVNNEVTRLSIRENIVGQWFMMTLQMFSSIGPMLLYLIGGLILIKNGSMTVGGIVMFVGLLSRLYGPVNTFSNIHVDIVRSLALFDRIFQYLDLKSEIVEKPGAMSNISLKGDIKFDNVSFAYSEKAATLKNVNLEIKAGQMAAFVGHSGAGKTTITYLVPRLYDVTDGAVIIDGMDIRDMTLETLRRQIGMVTQDTFLFNTTIRANLLLAREDATEEDMVEACKMANIHDFIASLPDGYETIVGDRGIKLSGGEKQRVSIARTLLKNPRIVIFDEATSALDSNSEALIQDAVEPLLKSRTSLVIAHRLSTIMSADIIFVVNEGQIVESGTHLELLELGGYYKELHDKQFRYRDKRHPEDSGPEDVPYMRAPEGAFAAGANGAFAPGKMPPPEFRQQFGSPQGRPPQSGPPQG
jgi:ATP-binding cassette subfamily B protein